MSVRSPHRALGRRGDASALGVNQFLRKLNQRTSRRIVSNKLDREGSLQLRTDVMVNTFALSRRWGRLRKESGLANGEKLQKAIICSFE